MMTAAHSMYNVTAGVNEAPKTAAGELGDAKNTSTVIHQIISIQCTF